MLLDDFFPEANSIKSDNSKEKSGTDSQDTGENKYSDEEIKENSDGRENSDGSSLDLKKEYDSDNGIENGMTKTVLPEDLQELVKEALAELKPAEF